MLLASELLECVLINPKIVIYWNYEEVKTNIKEAFVKQTVSYGGIHWIGRYPKVSYKISLPILPLPSI